MSSFVPDPLDDFPPPLGEEPNHPEHPQDPGEANLDISEMLQVVVNNPLDDTLPPLSEEPSQPEHPHDQEETHLNGIQCVAITACIDDFPQAIRATDLTLGLQRIPAGFHVTVQADGAEWQTGRKPVHVDQTVVEWNEHILLSSEPSSKVRVSVYASFELGPMLGHGELLRTFEISVGELLVRSGKSHLEQRRSDEHEALVLRPLTPLTSGDMQTLVLKTDAGHRLLARYRRTQNSRDLDQSIRHFERPSDLCPIDHPCRPAALCNLANAKFVSCQANGTYLDLDIPISLFQDAVDLRFTGHPDRPVTQLYLAIALLSRFAQRGFQTDADAAEELLCDVLDICHVNSHVYRAALLAIEMSALHPAGSIDANDLGQERPVVSMLPLSPDELARRAQWCLRRDDPRILDEVISLHYDALGYYSTAHAQRAHLLCNLGSMLLTRFERRGNSQDLDKAIALQREALALRPVGHPDRSASLFNLATGFSSRFEHRGNSQDLDEAIVLGREVLALLPVGHPYRSASFSNLGIHLSTRFKHRGKDQDLDEAISLQRKGLSLHLIGHPDRATSLNNLAIGLFFRFERRGNGQDLDEAIVLYREALALLPREGLALHPVGHSDRSASLNNLAMGLSLRFKHRGNDQDLDEAIMLQREALALRPVSDPDRSMSFGNLGSLLSTRFKHRGNDQDLDEAIMLQREALALLPDDHPDRPFSLNNLGNHLSTSFGHRGNVPDLNESIESYRCALTLLTQDDPGQSMIHLSLATVYVLFHQAGLDGTGQDTDSLNAAMHHFKAASNVVSGGLLSRLRASVHWIAHAEQHMHGTELEAYATSMQLLDAYMSATASVSSRHNATKFFPPTLTVNAASRALRSGDVCRAVELLEQGRTLIWTQIARFRTPIDTLQERGDHAETLMMKFRYLSSLLDKPPAKDSEGTRRVDVEAEATRYRRLVEDWNTTVEEIRKVKGFSRFLLPPLFLDLQDAARDGPIIVLIASKLSCAAIIVLHQEPPVSVELTINVENLGRLVIALQQTVEKEAGPQETQAKLIETLRKLSLPVSFAAIGQNHPPGHKFPLTCVEPELDLIHFACHGTQNFVEPFKSAFLMRDQLLQLLDISQMDLSRHEFAFLSACETAVGDFNTPDEVIHLAAGLQFSGVKSVVGTLWKVNDSTVQRLVEAFYKNFCGDGKMNSKRAARALHKAVQSLACDKDVPLDQRIVFMHIGL
ncbi:CHAT domain-containing protein [Suillus ampliporus]|nr:CHAT domain-containing protein [Suillus ampliporus]